VFRGTARIGKIFSKKTQKKNPKMKCLHQVRTVTNTAKCSISALPSLIEIELRKENMNIPYQLVYTCSRLLPQIIT
jgi:hypothetical protein